MKRYLFLIACCVVLVSACSKSSPTPDVTNNILTIDSSQFNGRLVITTLDYTNLNTLGNTDVYLFTNYDDIKRHLFLNYLRSTSSYGVADFGFILQGNYYVVSLNGAKGDTTLVQVLGQKVFKKNVYLK